MLKNGLNAQVNIKFNPQTNRQLTVLHKKLCDVDIKLKSIATTAAASSSSMSRMNSSVQAGATASKNAAAAGQKQAASNKAIGQSAKEATTFTEELGRAGGLALKRFAGFTIATGVVFGFGRALISAVGAAIKFERELVKIAQVRNTTLGSLQGLTSEITRLS